jgi:hypothetical protein
LKKKDIGKIEETGDFSSIDLYKINDTRRRRHHLSSKLG